MENRAHAIIAVTFLLVFSLGAIAVYYWLANQHHEPLAYAIVTSESVGGLAPQSPVRFKGLVVGHVTRIGFDHANRADVRIDLHLRPHTYVTHATYAVVAMQGLAGGSVLELKLGAGSRAPLATNPAHPALIPLREGTLGSLMADAPAIAKQLQQTLAGIDQVLDAANRGHLAATLAQLDAATRQLAAIETRLPPLLDSLKQSSDASHALIADSDHLVRAARAPVQDSAKLEASITALAQSTQRLSTQLNRQSLPDFDAMSASLQRTSAELNQLLRQLQARPQSLLLGPAKSAPGPGEPGFKPNPDGGPQ